MLRRVHVAAAAGRRFGARLLCSGAATLATQDSGEAEQAGTHQRQRTGFGDLHGDGGVV